MRYIFRLEKLVRDRMPEIISEAGDIAEVTTLDHKEHIMALKAKLQEEAEEVAVATSRSEIIEEMADVKEVLDALMLKLSINQNEIDEIKKQKSLKNGGFNRGLFIKTVESAAGSPQAIKFLKQPLKYPLL